MADTPKTGLSPVVPIEEQLRGLREAEAANPEYLRARDQARAEMQRKRQMRQMQGLMEGLEDPEKAGFMGRSIPEFREQDRRNEMRQMQPPQLSAAQIDEARRRGFLGPAVPIEESMQRQRDAEEQNRLNAVRAGVGREFPDMDPRALMGMSMEEIDQMRQRRERERMMQISQAIERGTRMLQRDPNNIQLRRDLQTLQRQQQELPSQGMNQTLQSAMPVGPNTVIR